MKRGVSAAEVASQKKLGQGHVLRRFVLRNEFFGSVVYDRNEKEYFHFDHLATALLKQPSRSFTHRDLELFDTSYAEIDELLGDLLKSGMVGETEFRDNQPTEGVLSAPTRIFFDFTYRCPEKCSHCFTNSGSPRLDELTLAEKILIVDQMVEMACFRLSIAGGEPLADASFFDFAEYAIAHGVDVSVSTSGIPVTQRTAKKLGTLDIRTINISLDGWDDESYGMVRGKGRLPYMVRGVKTLRAHYGGKLAGKCTLMTSNITNLPQLIAFAEELGLDVVKFNCVREAGRAIHASSLLPTQEQYIEAIKQLADIYNAQKAGKSPFHIKIVLPVNPFQQFEGDDPDVIDDLGFGCYAGRESFCINPVGDMQPCSSFGPSMFVDGNVRTTRLIEAWKSGASMNRFRSLKGSEDCVSCQSYEGCRGGCYLRSFVATGDLNATDPYCYERKNNIMRSNKGSMVPIVMKGQIHDLT